MKRSAFFLFAFLLGISAIVNAQTYAPMVSMTITLPDGSTQDVSARESAAATITAKDGTVYEVRPTVHDEPFTTATIAIFKAPTANDAGSFVAEVQAKKGAPAVTTKSNPAFKVAVKNIDLSGK